MHWTYETIQYHLNHWGLLPSSWKSYFIQWHFSFQKVRKQWSCLILWDSLKKYWSVKQIALSNCSYKPIRLLNISKTWKVDRFTRVEIGVNFLTWCLLFCEDQVERSELQAFKTKHLFHYLTQCLWKTVLCDMPLWVLIYDWRFDGKLSGDLLSLYFLYIDFTGRKKQLQWQHFPFRLHRYSAHNFQWLNRIQLTYHCPASFHYFNHEEEMTQFLMALAFSFMDI